MVSWLIVCFDPCCLTPSAGWRRTECLKHWWNVACQANFLRTGWWMRGGYSSLQGEMRVKLLYMPQGAIAATLGVLRARRRDGFTNCVFLAIRRRLKRPSRLQQPPCDFSLHKCLPQHDFRSNLPARYPDHLRSRLRPKPFLLTCSFEAGDSAGSRWPIALMSGVAMWFDRIVGPAYYEDHDSWRYDKRQRQYAN